MIPRGCIIKLVVVFELFLWSPRDINCHVIQTGEMSENKSCVLLDILNVAEKALHTAKQCVKVERRLDTGSPSTHPMDCAEIYDNNNSSLSGIYNIWPRSRILDGPITAYCDMTDDGGAWTVIQRRGDFDSPKDYFYRDWISYKKGFGDLLKDFWIGNDNIFALTSERSNSVKFTLSDWEGNVTYATYDDFWIDDEAQNYTMHVEGYRGTAGDSFSSTNDQQFTTKDRDNDKFNANCAVSFKGAWWYAACHASNLNGWYLKGAHESFADGVEWASFRGLYYSLKDVTIKIRPKNFLKTATTDTTPQ